MNTFKTAVVLATLLGVGYGVHVVLNKPLNTNYQQQAQAQLDEFGLPRLEIEGLQDANGDAGDNTVGGSGAFQSPQMITPDRAPDYQIVGDAPLQAPVGTGGTASGVANNFENPMSQGTDLAAAEHDSVPDLGLNPADFPDLPNIPAESSTPLTGGTTRQALTGGPMAQAAPDASGQPTFSSPNQAYPNTSLPAQFNGGVADIGPSSMANSPPAGVPSNEAAQLPQFASPADNDFSSGGRQQNSPPAVRTAANAAFANIWQSAQDKILAGQYDVALFTLSLWYSNPELTSEQRTALIPMLDELAGKVIYSREHHLEPPHTVRPGETLPQIARNYAVTPEFLARVNGLADHTTLTPGQQLKTVTGPFRAELSLSNREITIFVGSYYAGRFMAGVGRDLPLGEMALEVAEKSGSRPYLDRETNQQTVAGDPANPYGNYWIGLRSPGAVVNPYLGLHSTGSRVEASDTRGCVSLSDRDADDLQAILTIGSRVTVHR